VQPGAQSRFRQGYTFVLVAIALLALVASASTANADVDITGRLEKVNSSPLGSGLKPLSVTSENGDWRCSDPYSTVANWPYYYAIGNCPKGAELEVVSYASEDPATHEHSYGGFVNGAFSGCGWINTAFPLEKLNSAKHTVCAEESGGGFKVKESSFWEKLNSSNAQDGFYVVNKTACPEYANYRPWSENGAPKELIRTVPAYEREGPGEKASNPALKWRYVSKYSSVTEPKVKYVMVRDDRIAGGEGNWVFVPRSCLPSTLPTSEGEHLPPAPSVTTNEASNIATPRATLNATINPNGVETKYYFEYGTSLSYGSYTATASAGSGTSSVPVHAEVSGLAPGTSYYVRIVASSAIGESFGGTVAFTTQPASTVTTTAASGVLEEQVNLNGTVNPNGLETSYHFEYGETTTYGASTGTADAGSGTSTVPEGAVITGLEPDTTYHYRLVATSSAGSVMGSDETVTTPEPEADSRWAVRDAATGSQWVYFDSKEGRVCYWQELNGEFGSWADNCLGSGDYTAATAHITVARDQATGSQWVYFASKEGRICYWQEPNGELGNWAENCLGTGEYVTPGTHPDVVRDQTTGSQWVYFASKEGRICYWQEANGEFGSWAENCLGTGEYTVPTSNLSIARTESTDSQWVYFANKEGRICYWEELDGGFGSWAENCLGSGEYVTGGTHLTAVGNPVSNSQWVSFVNKEGRVCYWQEANGSFGSWAQNCLGAGEYASTTSGLAAVYKPATGSQWTYWVGKEGRACYWQEWNGEFGGWADNCLGTGEYTASGSGLAVVSAGASNSQWLYLAGGEGRLCYWEEVDGSFSWAENCLGSGEYIAPGST
jgi:hypothetical protein